MTELERLIDSYWDGTISPVEKQRLFALIEEDTTDYGSNGYARYLQTISVESAATNRKDEHFQMQLNEIKTKLGMSKSNAPLPMTRSGILAWKWYAAASILLVIGCCYWLMNKPARQDRLTKSEGPAVMVAYQNNSDRIIDSLLPDGSAVRLYPGSALRFAKAFSDGKRDIRMSGKIVFTVQKDSTRPFTVYAGGFSTIVLGTQFEVNTDHTNKFIVRLISGKVVVRSTETSQKPMTAVYLRPGERLTYDLHLRRSRVDDGLDSLKKNEKMVTAKSPGRPASELTFSNLPLNILFRQLEQEYGITIWCDENLARDKLYSGTFLKEDNPARILDQIVRKFHLRVHKEDNAFIVE
jgi:ferric-dicitrate binding protein FerR (iron transport regulator)